jgi:hypothetical protein
MSKSISLAVLRQHDAAHDDCTVRQIEMFVDAATNYHVDLTMQFWRDATIYSVREAVSLLVDYHCSSPTLAADVQKVLERVK